MRATNEQIERVKIMLQSCDDWDEDEQAAVGAVLTELAALRGLRDAVGRFYVCHNIEDGFGDSKKKMFDALWKSQRKETT